jgi:hypothetical protein
MLQEKDDVEGGYSFLGVGALSNVIRISPMTAIEASAKNAKS